MVFYGILYPFTPIVYNFNVRNCQLDGSLYDEYINIITFPSFSGNLYINPIWSNVTGCEKSMTFSLLKLRVKIDVVKSIFWRIVDFHV